MSLVKTEILCKGLWENHLAVMLPLLTEGELLFLDFTMPKVAHINGLFVVDRTLHMYVSTENGYVQRVSLSPHEETREMTHRIAEGGLE